MYTQGVWKILVSSYNLAVPCVQQSFKEGQNMENEPFQMCVYMYHFVKCM